MSPYIISVLKFNPKIKIGLKYTELKICQRRVLKLVDKAVKPTFIANGQPKYFCFQFLLDRAENDKDGYRNILSRFIEAMGDELLS